MKVVIVLACCAFFAVRALQNVPDRAPIDGLFTTPYVVPQHIFRFADFPIETDTLFIQTAIQDLLYEMRLSKLALDRSSTEAVRRLAEQIFNDNSIMVREFADLIGSDMMSADEGLTGEYFIANGFDSTETTTIRRPDHTDYGLLQGTDLDLQWISDMQLSSRSRLDAAQSEMLQTNDRGLILSLKRSMQLIQQHLDQLQTVRLSLS